MLKALILPIKFYDGGVTTVKPIAGAYVVPPPVSILDNLNIPISVWTGDAGAIRDFVSVRPYDKEIIENDWKLNGNDVIAGTARAVTDKKNNLYFFEISNQEFLIIYTGQVFLGMENIEKKIKDAYLSVLDIILSYEIKKVVIVPLGIKSGISSRLVSKNLCDAIQQTKDKFNNKTEIIISLSQGSLSNNQSIEYEFCINLLFLFTQPCQSKTTTSRRTDVQSVVPSTAQGGPRTIPQTQRRTDVPSVVLQNDPITRPLLTPFLQAACVSPPAKNTFPQEIFSFQQGITPHVVSIQDITPSRAAVSSKSSAMSFRRSIYRKTAGKTTSAT